jgi:hypothetical protein
MSMNGAHGFCGCGIEQSLSQLLWSCYQGQSHTPHMNLRHGFPRDLPGALATCLMQGLAEFQAQFVRFYARRFVVTPRVRSNSSMRVLNCVQTTRYNGVQRLTLLQAWLIAIYFSFFGFFRCSFMLHQPADLSKTIHRFQAPAFMLTYGSQLNTLVVGLQVTAARCPVTG